MIKCVVSNFLEVTGLSKEFEDWVSGYCNFNVSGFSSDEIPTNLHLFERTDSGAIRIPRGYLSIVEQEAKRSGQELEVVYDTAPYTETKFKINPKINYKTGVFSYQDSTVKQALQHNHIRIMAPTGSGKTLISCLIMAKLNKGPTLFLVNKDRLLQQFVDTAITVLQLAKEEIGIIKAKKFSIKDVTVGSLQTMCRDTFDLDALKKAFHVVFFDECHISSALSYRKVILGLAPYRLYGLSATPEHYANKELNNLMNGLLGPISVVIKESQIPERISPQTFTRETGKVFKYNADSSDPAWRQHKERNNLYNAIAADSKRNAMIIEDCLKLVELDHKVLITVSRVEHGRVLNELLKDKGIRTSFPYKIVERKNKETDQKVDHKTLNKEVSEILTGNIDVLIGTYSLFQTGFDCKTLSALLLSSPFSGSNTTMLTQVMGRIQRYAIGKTEAMAIYYSDDSHDVNMLRDWSDAFAENATKMFAGHKILNS